MAIDHTLAIVRTNPFSPMNVKIMDKKLHIIRVASNDGVRCSVHKNKCY